MGKVLTYEGTFKQAFKAARKHGDKLFKWYNPRHKLAEIYTTDYSPDKIDTQKSATVSSRKDQKTVYKKGKTEVKVGDKVTMGGVKGTVMTSKGKDGNLFGGNLGEISIVAPLRKINRKTPGYLPVDSRTDLVDANGDTRVYKLRDSNLYVITDEDGVIRWRTTDPNAEKIGFNLFIPTDNSKEDLAARASAKLADRANMNEVNLKDLLKLDRERSGEEGIIQDIHKGRTMAANVANQYINIPVHATTGALRLLTSPNYTGEDYLKGFNLNYSYLPLGQTNGFGDLIADHMESGTLRDIAQLGGNLYTVPILQTSFKFPTSKLSVVQKTPTTYRIRTTEGPVSGFRRGTRANEGMGSGFVRGGYNTLYGAHSWGGHNLGALETFKVANPTLQVTNTPGHFSIGNTPWHSITADLPEETKRTEINEPVSYYYLPGVPNYFIEHGHVSPWNSDKEYTPKLSGSVDVYDSLNQNITSWGGKTQGSGGRDNKTYPTVVTRKTGGKLLKKNKLWIK